MRAAKPYWALLRQQMISGLQFRAALWAKLTTNIFWGIVRVVTIYVFYLYGSGDGSALSLPQAVSMIWLQQVALNLLPGFGMDFSVWNKIRSGDVAYELLRPLDVYGHWYMNAIAIKLAPFLVAVVPVTGVALLLPGGYGLAAPASALHLVTCLITLITGLATSCAGILLTYAMLMDAHVGDAPASIAMSVMQLLAGSILPLQLWPEWMQTFLALQPFAGMMDLPLRFYVGAAPLSDFAKVLALQLFWGGIMVVAGRMWIGRSLKKLVIQGG